MKIYIDGGVKNQHLRYGREGYTAMVIDGEEIVEPVDVETNNRAEYLALIKALTVALRRNAKDVEVLSDSELLVSQMNGKFKVKNKQLRELHRQASNMKDKFASFRMRWIGRSENLAGKLLEKIAQ